MQKIQQGSLGYLDQIAAIKREKDLQISDLLADFRAQKEAILDKASRDKHVREDKIRETKLNSDKLVDSLRQKNTQKYLQAEKKFEEA